MGTITSALGRKKSTVFVPPIFRFSTAIHHINWPVGPDTPNQKFVDLRQNDLANSSHVASDLGQDRVRGISQVGSRPPRSKASPPHRALDLSPSKRVPLGPCSVHCLRSWSPPWIPPGHSRPGLSGSVLCVSTVELLPARTSLQVSTDMAMVAMASIG